MLPMEWTVSPGSGLAAASGIASTPFRDAVEPDHREVGVLVDRDDPPGMPSRLARSR